MELKKFFVEVLNLNFEFFDFDCNKIVKPGRWKRKKERTSSTTASSTFDVLYVQNRYSLDEQLLQLFVHVMYKKLKLKEWSSVAGWLALLFQDDHGLARLGLLAAHLLVGLVAAVDRLHVDVLRRVGAFLLLLDPVRLVLVLARVVDGQRGRTVVVIVALGHAIAVAVTVAVAIAVGQGLGAVARAVGGVSIHLFRLLRFALALDLGKRGVQLLVLLVDELERVAAQLAHMLDLDFLADVAGKAEIPVS